MVLERPSSLGEVCWLSLENIIRSAVKCTVSLGWLGSRAAIAWIREPLLPLCSLYIAFPTQQLSP